MTTFPVLLGAIVIDDDNDTIRIVEDVTTTDVAVAHGTYYLRSASAADNILDAVKTAIDGAGVGGNAYTLTVTWSRSTSARAATVTIARTSGSDGFRIRWAHASTTFPSAALGFTAEKVAVNSSNEVSDVSPTSVWVGDNYHEDTRGLPEWAGTEQKLENGGTSFVRHGLKRTDRTLVLPMCSDANLFVDDEAVTNRSLEAFVDENGDGRPVEFHTRALEAGSDTAIDTITTSSRVGTYVLGEQAVSALANSERSGTGLTQSDLSLVLMGYVA